MVSSRTRDLTPDQVAGIRRLLWEAFAGDDDPFTETDWQHAVGGAHFLLERDGAVVTHASVVEREILVAGVPLRTGFVEAVATLPRLQGQGLGTRVMRAVTAHVRDTFELGALGTGRHHFYERLGWVTWRGPSSVMTPEGTFGTPDEDGYILLLATTNSPPLDPAAPIACHWRPGDVW